jgi:uncharacterized protein
MDMRSMLHSRRDDILSLAARHGARNVRAFGSVARGEAGPDGDVDILVDIEPGRSRSLSVVCCMIFKPC